MLALIGAWCAAARSTTMAADVGAAYSFFAGTTDNDGFETDTREQRGSASVFQTLTPYLGARFNYQYFEFESESGLQTVQRRESREPRLELGYSRRRLSAQLSAFRRRTEGSAPSDNFDSDSFLASVAWRPSRGPGFQASFRDQSNVSDVSVFGRDTQSRFITFETDYDRDWGGVSYRFSRADVDNRTSGFSSDQNRHELRLTSYRSFLDGGVTLDGGLNVSRLSQTTRISDEPDLADPVPARTGLFAIDPSPGLGELDPAPGLTDGDESSPVAPEIDVGGANTLRNVGVDLGFASLVSRLEIFVDAVSEPNLVWEVYHSPDNLIWVPLAGSTSTWDGARLRYRLDLPQTTDRYFKAVNVSVNSEPTVRVTEIRALLEIQVAAETSAFESTLYQANLGARFRPTDDVSVRIDAGFSNDEDLAAGLTRRDFRSVYASARSTVLLADALRLTAGYRYDDIENRRQPVLLRTEHAYNVGLFWTPIATVDGVLTLQRRDEFEEDLRLQTNESARVRFTLGLLPDLRWTTDAAVVRVDDPFSGFDRQGWSLQQRLSARPARRWTVSADYRVSDFETPEGDEVLRRTGYGASTSWSPTPLLSLSGSWGVARERDQDNFRQSYSLSYNPGPKLSISAGYQEFEATGTSGTSSDSITVNYRAGRHVSFFASASRSISERLGVRTGEISSLRAGLRVFL